MKKIKSKVIECVVLFQNPNALMKLVIPSNSIDTLILDLQEEYPDRNITRASVRTWKFMTVADYKKLQSEKWDLPKLSKNGTLEIPVIREQRIVEGL